MIMTETSVTEMDYATVSRVHDAWENSERGLNGKGMLNDGGGGLFEFWSASNATQLS